MKRILVTVIMAVFMMSSFAFAQDAASPRTIGVTGEGEVSVVPNQAVITFSVDTVNMDARKAVDENNAIVNKFKADIIKLGVKESNIKTTSYNFFKDYEYDSQTNKQIFKGYRLVNAFEVKVENIQMVGDVLNKAVEDGITGMSNVAFSVLEKDKYYAEALKKAVANGKSKADAIAQGLGTTVKEPLKVTEVSANYPVVYPVMMLEKSAADAGSAISQGELTIKAIVSMEYAY